MDNNDFIIKLQRREDELIKICKYHNMNLESSKDIIQDMYIKLLLFKNIDKYIKYDEPNMYIIFMILRNLIFDFRKKEKKYSDEIIDFIDINNMEEIDNKIYEKIPDEKDNYKYEYILTEMELIPYWFDRKIVELYIKEGVSIRQLCRECGIKFHVIQPIIRKFKLQCREKYKK